MTRQEQPVRRQGVSPKSLTRPARAGRAAGTFLMQSEGGFTMEPSKEQKNRFQIEQLEERIAPTIVAVNGGGNTPNGEANGVPRENPAGQAPPGHN
jgi:hypothetical protein